MRSGRRDRRRRSTQRSSEKLLEADLTVLVIGIALWVAPMFLNGNPLLGGLAQGLRIPAQLLTGIGAVLLVIYALARRAAEPNEVAPTSPRAVTPRRSNVAERKEPVMAPLSGEQQPALTSWNDDVLAKIEWRRFEALVEALFAQAGFETRSQSHGADGGVDIWLHSKNAEGPVAVVQCKHWQGKPVGVREMREFLGVMVSHGLRRGVLGLRELPEVPGNIADAVRGSSQNGDEVTRTQWPVPVFTSETTAPFAYFFTSCRRMSASLACRRRWLSAPTRSRILRPADRLCSCGSTNS